MNITQAIETLQKHNEWRRWDAEDPLEEDPSFGAPEMTNPTQLGIAIDTIVEYHKVIRPIKPAEDELTIRDQFAMTAMQGLISAGNTDNLTRDAYYYASLMMEERSQHE